MSEFDAFENQFTQEDEVNADLGALNDLLDTSSPLVRLVARGKAKHAAEVLHTEADSFLALAEVMPGRTWTAEEIAGILVADTEPCEFMATTGRVPATTDITEHPIWAEARALYEQREGK
jgi:hypothetical protein